MAEAEGKLIQHLGIVAGVCEEIGLAKLIDAHIEKQKRKVSVGAAVKAMILNALGFTGRALYLTPEFYRTRPVDVLLGEGIRAEDLHDDCLGTALDALYEYGVTELFYELASHGLEIFGVEHRFVHLDSTTFSLHGAYQEDEDEQEEGAPQVISITKGYSKDSAPDLNQVVVSLMCAYRSSIPVWIEVLSGNSSDKVSFRKSIAEYRNQFQAKRLPYFVADSALYTEENLKQLQGVKWVTRVPETLKEAKQRISKLKIDSMSECGDGYRVSVVPSSYAGVAQRWVLVFSEQAQLREMKTFTKNFTIRTEEAENSCGTLATVTSHARPMLAKRQSGSPSHCAITASTIGLSASSTTRRRVGLRRIPHPAARAGSSELSSERTSLPSKQPRSQREYSSSQPMNSKNPSLPLRELLRSTRPKGFRLNEASDS